MSELIKSCRRWPEVLRLEVCAVVVCLLLGGLTALGQQNLPDTLRSLANSAGAWTFVAFVAAWRATGAIRAAVTGALALWSLLAGYVLLNAAESVSSAASTIVFWSAMGLLAGPALGLAAQAARRRDWVWSAAGSSLLGGVLIGEGVYGLTVIADSTSPVYWWIQITLAVIAECVIGWLRRWRTRAVLLAAGLTAAVAVAFRFGYATVGALL